MTELTWYLGDRCGSVIPPVQAQHWQQTSIELPKFLQAVQSQT
jgi:hypothetical protein